MCVISYFPKAYLSSQTVPILWNERATPSSLVSAEFSSVTSTCWGEWTSQGVPRISECLRTTTLVHVKHPLGLTGKRVYPECIECMEHRTCSEIQGAWVTVPLRISPTVLSANLSLLTHCSPDKRSSHPDGWGSHVRRVSIWWSESLWMAGWWDPYVSSSLLPLTLWCRTTDALSLSFPMFWPRPYIWRCFILFPARIWITYFEVFLSPLSACLSQCGSPKV